MAGEIHPGSFVGDSIEEFKKLPTWGKIAIGAGLVLVIFLFIRARQQAAANAASTGTMADMSSGLGGNTPMIGNTPLVPGGLSPVYDPNGNLIGWQPNPTPNPTPTVGPNAGQPGIPLIPWGQYGGPDYSNLPANSTYTFNGVKYLLSTGGGGRLYGQALNPTSGGGYSVNPIKILLYGPESSYNQTQATQQPGSTQGGGNPPTQGSLFATATGSAPYQSSYTAPAAPRLSTYTVLQGDTPNGIAARLNYPGGGPALVADSGGSIRPGQVLQVQAR